MTTTMEHPKHGRHPAIGSEIEHMRANGWTVCAPKGALTAPEAPQGAIASGHVETAAAITGTPPVRRTRGPNKPRAE